MSVLYRALSRAAAEAGQTEPPAPEPRPGRWQGLAAGGAVLAAVVVAGLYLALRPGPPDGRGPDGAADQADSGPPARSLYLAPPVTDSERDRDEAPAGAPAVTLSARPPEPPPSPAAQLAPESPAAKAWAHLALGRVSEALAAFESLLAEAPDNANLLLGRAEALARLGRREAALEAYEAVLRRAPDDDRALGQLVRLIGRNRPRDVLERLQGLHSAHPEHAGIAAQIGMTYVQLGDLGRALDFLAGAARQEPDRAVYVFNLGVLNDRLGNRRDAMALYEKALKLGVPAAVPKAAVKDRLAYLRRVVRD